MYIYIYIYIYIHVYIINTYLIYNIYNYNSIQHYYIKYEIYI